MAAKPMLDGVELQQVQQIVGDQQETYNQHDIPALEGDFLQDMGRRSVRIRLTGVLTGPDAPKGLETLRGKFRTGEPVTFVADIATATKVNKMLIEELGVRELAGKPSRFEYSVMLAEFIGPAPKKSSKPAAPPRATPPQVRSGNLFVEIGNVERPGIDFSNATVLITSVESNAPQLSRTLSNRKGNLWIEENLPPRRYTATIVSVNPPLFGSADVTVRASQTAQVTLKPLPEAVVAKAFVVHFSPGSSFLEPSMRAVLQQAADYSRDHPGEKLWIAGHADGSDPEDYHQILSEQRALGVFACLTYGRNPDSALAAWRSIRSATLRGRAKPWGRREYQFILQDLGYYRGQIGEDRELTDVVVSDFQLDQKIAVDGIMSNATWDALVRAYLSQNPLAVPENRFLPGAWAGFGKQFPVKNTRDAWRPNRRAEVLFVPLGTSPRNVSKLIVLPAEIGTVDVRGCIKFENGAPAANLRYVLIAPDGECMDGEIPSGSDRGRPIPARTAADGSFAYHDKPKGIGIYTLEALGPYIARAAGEPPSAAKGTHIATRLDSSSNFLDVTVSRT